MASRRSPPNNGVRAPASAAAASASPSACSVDDPGRVVPPMPTMRSGRSTIREHTARAPILDPGVVMAKLGDHRGAIRALGRDRPQRGGARPPETGRWRGLENAVDRCGALRSEEHTSELQSLMRNSNAVFCLKKK